MNMGICLRSRHSSWKYDMDSTVNDLQQKANMVDNIIYLYTAELLLFNQYYLSGCLLHFQSLCWAPADQQPDQQYEKGSDLHDLRLHGSSPLMGALFIHQWQTKKQSKRGKPSHSCKPRVLRGWSVSNPAWLQNGRYSSSCLVHWSRMKIALQHQSQNNVDARTQMKGEQQAAALCSASWDARGSALYLWAAFQPSIPLTEFIICQGSNV